MKNENKEYITPEFQFNSIRMEDVLSASTPGGGSWNYFDEDPTTTTDPFFDDSDFWD